MSKSNNSWRFAWVWDCSLLKKIGMHFKSFPYIWICFLLILLATLVGSNGNAWSLGVRMLGVSLSIMVALVLIRPMNAVYGLMGASGDIRILFVTFILITLFFAGVYQIGFFKNAGITYDVNQPHIDYDFYQGKERWSMKEPIVKSYALKKIVGNETIEETVEQVDTLIYQPISFGQTWRNTIMTTLMQEPTEFFSAAATYNAGMTMDGEGILEQSKVKAFHWLLIIQILISWIFFGVFISLLYSKFRNES